MEEKRINWRYILLSTIVTGIMTIVTGVLLSYIQNREPKLVYMVSDTSPFRGTDKNFAIYNLSISNSGGKAISNVVSTIKVPLASFDDAEITAPETLKVNRADIKDGLEFSVSELNPKEMIEISVLVSSQAELPKRPNVAVRGSGQTGLPKTSQQKTKFGAPALVSAIVGAYSGMFLMFLMLFAKRKTLLKDLISILGRGTVSSNQNEIFVYLCSIHGLTNDVNEYLSVRREILYRTESDRFATIALDNPFSEEAEKRKKILEQLIEFAPHMATSSRAIVHFNIARILFAQGKASG